MPWTEMSQEEFLRYVATFPAELPKLMADDKMLQVSLSLMEQVVRDPERLYRSVYKVLHNKDYRTLEAAQHSKGKKDGVTPSNKDSASATEESPHGSSCAIQLVGPEVPVLLHATLPIPCHVATRRR